MPRSLAALIVIGVAGAAAPAQSATTQPAPLWGYLGLASPQPAPDAISAFTHAGVTLRQAIDDAQRSNAGKAIEIGFMKQRPGWAYAVTLDTPAGLHHVLINPGTGAASSTGAPDVPRRDLDAAGLRDLDSMQSAIPLAQAAAAAERLAGGRAIAAGLEQLGGIPQYYVQVVTGTKIRAVIVNPATGRAAPPSD
jgi:uncharacterized membrane protein YkoI